MPTKATSSYGDKMLQARLRRLRWRAAARRVTISCGDEFLRVVTRLRRIRREGTRELEETQEKDRERQMLGFFLHYLKINSKTGPVPSGFLLGTGNRTGYNRFLKNITRFWTGSNRNLFWIYFSRGLVWFPGKPDPVVHP